MGTVSACGAEEGQEGFIRCFLKQGSAVQFAPTPCGALNDSQIQAGEGSAPHFFIVAARLLPTSHQDTQRLHKLTLQRNPSIDSNTCINYERYEQTYEEQLDAAQTDRKTSPPLLEVAAISMPVYRSYREINRIKLPMHRRTRRTLMA